MAIDISELRNLKNAMRRIESNSKVTGTAQYLDDMEMQGMTYGGIVRSPYPHCKVKSVDLDEVRNMPGVLVVLTPDDVPKTKFNCTGSLPAPVLIEDESVLTWHPLHEGDRIIAVCAESRDILEKALEAVKIEYEILPATMDTDTARKDERLINPDMYDTNVFFHKIGTRGDVEEGFKECDEIFEGEYRTPTQHPIPMELIGCIVHWNRDGKIHSWATSQVPYQDRRILAHIFGLPESDISCHRAMIGGGFGQREEMYDQDVAACLSREIFRPVKMLHNRNDEMIATAVRHSSHSYVKIGVKEDMTMLAFHQTMYTNAGGYCTHTPLVTAAPDRKYPYNPKYFRYDGIGVLTNAAVSGAFRGYGNPQGTFGRETLINEICRAKGWDPIEFRRKNCIKPGEKMHGYPCVLSTFPYDQVFDNGKKIRDEIDAKEGLRDDDEVKEAWGYGFMNHTSSISSLEGLTAASIICLPDGSVSLMTGTTDMGNGSETAMVMVAAEKLGMDVSEIRHADLDTSTSPYNIGSYSSGQMFLTGNAVAGACEDVIQKVQRGLCKKYNRELTDFQFRDGHYYSMYDGKRYTFKEGVLDLCEKSRGTYIMGSYVAHLEDAPPPFCFALAKVRYYKKENAIKLTHLVESVDIGRMMNPLICKGQLEGAMQMAAGYVLIEDLEYDKKTNKYITGDLLNYRNPLIMDMPETHVAVADTYEPKSANGTKSCGEMGLIPIAPAVIDAVANATGTVHHDFPLSHYYYIKNSRYDDVYDAYADEEGEEE